MSKFLLRISIILLTILITLITLSFLQPVLYCNFSSDFRRHLVIEKYLEQEKSKNKGEVIIFGDSRTMYGIDSRIIRNLINISGEAINLSSVDQHLYESSYYYSRITRDTKLVLQCTSPAFFSRDLEHGLATNKAMSMFLSGYRIDKSTKELISNYKSYFVRNEFVNYFDSRPYVKSYIHNLIRPLFDNEAFEGESGSSIYFPHTYTTDRHPNYPVYEYSCNEYVPKSNPISQMEFIKKTVNYFNEKSIKYIIVLMPVNPDICSECYEDFKKYADDLAQIEGLYIIDLTNLLTTEFFYDGLHANKKGAELISQEIGKEILQFNLLDK